ncbi:carbohydrate deacetylase isoform X2 [Bombina bombina]|uniref:carbohydrate deacetylase isoform X2 n=1 Tax=Bombina bombina TaxID=8345 RepID=UPI00235B269A|nr:carbohydrate deacetylase isoform X2 [Bombina bombina]
MLQEMKVLGLKRLGHGVTGDIIPHRMPLDFTVKLVVTGDDFGYCPLRDQGIVECFKAGAISNCSLLVNGSSAACAAELAQRCNIPIGLHANLSEGFPVCTELRHNSSLVNSKGVFHGKMGIRKKLAQGLLNMSEVRQELSAQILLFREMTGHNPQHMDGHQHIHVLPRINEVFAQVLQENEICFTRIPVELGLRKCDWIKEDLMTFYQGVKEDSINTVEVFRSHGIRWPDLYIGLSTMGGNMSISNIQRAIEYSIQSLLWKSSNYLHHPTLNSRHTLSIELMTHPGYPSIPPVGGCGEGPDDFSQSEERLHEMKVLKDPVLQDYYKEHGVQLCSFKEL